MLNFPNQNSNPFAQKVRVRACGIYIEENKILLLKHKGIGSGDFLWAPPGGGVEFGESLKEAIKREFLEETHLVVETNNFLFVNEHMDENHHALEFFFSVNKIAGKFKLGRDPELSKSSQMIQEGRFFAFNELLSLPKINVHSIFHSFKSLGELLKTRQTPFFSH